MTIMTIDTSNPNQLPAAFAAAMRGDPGKITFTGPTPHYEQCVKEAGIIVEVQSSAKQ